MKKKSMKANVCGIISLTLSVISCIVNALSILLFPFSCIGMITAVSSMILGIVACTDKEAEKATAIAGIIDSAIAIVLGILGILVICMLGGMVLLLSWIMTQMH